MTDSFRVMKTAVLLVTLVACIRFSLAFDCTYYDGNFADCPLATCVWISSTETCECGSDVKQDIFFSIDASGSIGRANFQVAKSWLVNITTKYISNFSRMAFATYSTEINISTWSELQFWDTDDLTQFLTTLRYSRGWTSTDLITLAMVAEFNRTAEQDEINDFDNSRQRINFLITDGNPCSDDECPYDVCYVSEDVKREDIRIILIGVGSNLNPSYLDCLLDDPDTDYFPVTSYTADAFDAIFSDLQDILCPVTYEIQITEVKVTSTGVYASDDDDLTVRFLEIWNKGTQLNLSHIEIYGYIETNSSFFMYYDDLIDQQQYFVYYDGSTGSTFPNVTCAECGTSSCDRDHCSGDTDPCHCSNSIYIECGNCTSGDALVEYGCCFNNVDENGKAYNRTYWNVTVDDVQEDALLLDNVEYDASTWIKIELGYSYELKAKGFDNDLGGNWAQPCNNRGTPGADPGIICTKTCSSTSCTLNGGNGTCDGGFSCDCSNLCYYPLDLTCAIVPMPDSCTVLWTKDENTSIATAYFEWTVASTSLEIQYQLEYWSASGQATSQYTTTYSGYKIITNYLEIYDSDNAYNTFYSVYYTTSSGVAAGFLRSFFEVDGDNYYSCTIPCILSTSDPTPTPTKSPSTIPSKAPSDSPTPSPTHECVHFYFVPDTCLATPRCECNEATQTAAHGDPDWSCCDDPSDFTDTSPKDECTYKSIEIVGDTSIQVAQEPSPVTFNYDTQVCWELSNFLVVNSSDDRRRRQLENGNTIDVNYYVSNEHDYEMRQEMRMQQRRLLGDDDSNNITVDYSDYNAAGMRITPTSGCINISSRNTTYIDDDKFYVNLKIETVSCEELGKDDDCFDDIENVEYDLNLTSCVNAYGPNSCCYLNHPEYILLTIDRNSLLSGSGQTEDELPPWLWWLIAALAIFLIVLAFLVYKFWWSARKSGAALGETNAELDDAIAEQEHGFGGDLGDGQVNFNPLGAGGFNANPAGNAGAGPKGLGDGVSNDIARVQDERLVFKQQFGARQT